MKNGEQVTHDVAAGQLRFTFTGGMRGPDVYIHDVVITVGGDRDSFGFTNGVRVYGGGGAIVDGHPGVLGPHQTYRFVVDQTYPVRAAVQFFPTVGYGTNCGATEIGVQQNQT